MEIMRALQAFVSTSSLFSFCHAKYFVQNQIKLVVQLYENHNVFLIPSLFLALCIVHHLNLYGILEIVESLMKQMALWMTAWFPGSVAPALRSDSVGCMDDIILLTFPITYCPTQFTLLGSSFWIGDLGCMFLTNRYMITAPPRGQDVEWGYAFDVHLNAFFPLLLILHFFQLPLLHHFINQEYFISCFFGNTLWLIAIGYYIYITFLGYSALPFLKNTRTLLYPITGMVVVYILSLIFQWNFSWGLCSFYRNRVM